MPLSVRRNRSCYHKVMLGLDFDKTLLYYPINSTFFKHISSWFFLDIGGIIHEPGCIPNPASGEHWNMAPLYPGPSSCLASSLMLESYLIFRKYSNESEESAQPYLCMYGLSINSYSEYIH